jgi:hypothetical protein
MEVHGSIAGTDVAATTATVIAAVAATTTTTTTTTTIATAAAAASNPWKTAMFLALKIPPVSHNPVLISPPRDPHAYMKIFVKSPSNVLSPLIVAIRNMKASNTLFQIAAGRLSPS